MAGGSAPLRVVPGGSWAGAAFAGVVLASLFACAAEAAWRAHGQLPSADPEDLDLWAIERRKVSQASSQTIVIIGKSRAQLDVDEGTLRRRYPGFTLAQLALRGRGAFATFEDLARDPAFKGRILFFLEEPDLSLDENDAQRPAVDRARSAGPDARWNAAIRAAVGAHVVVRHPLLFPHRVLENLARGQLPAKSFVVTDPDRFGRADFSRADLDVVTGEIVGRLQGIADRMGALETPNVPWIYDIRRIPPLIDELRSRGGDVAFIHPPISGASEQFAQRFYPKDRFWDVFARTTPAVSLHFRDHPSLRAFTCADTSHLDQKDAPRFTAALLRELEKRSFLPRGSGGF